MQGSRPSGSDSRAKSFSRLEPSTDSPLTGTGASGGSGTSDGLFPESLILSPDSEAKAARTDIFTNAEDEDDTAVSASLDDPTIKLPETFDELPIEIRSLTERFLDSLSARVHPTPLTVDQLSQLFQDFYIKVASHIATHIATLASRISREQSNFSTSRGSGKSGPTNSRKSSSTDLAGGEQQMLTASELYSRKKARKQLELKRVALEEAVERAVCEKVYEKIYRHKSTDDEERDQKLRSRTAALSVVGIGLKELLVSKDEITDKANSVAIDEEDSVRESLSGARNHLKQMDDEKYPLGKLRHLTAAHKSVVETLSQVFPASSSADEILPTLIYSLITSSPEDINVISNLNFIQRFRASTKVDGEVGYCLVNLEAAVSFLETVDLSSLRADEPPEGPRKASQSLGSKGDAAPMKIGSATPATAATSSVVATSTTPTETSDPNATTQQPPSPTARTQRRLSHLMRVQTNRLEAASDAVRDSLRDGADQAIDTINNTLDNSFKFLFGRLKEQQVKSPETVVPRTLEEALKLVGTSSRTEDDASISVASSAHEKEDDSPDGPNPQHPENKLVDLIGGKRQLRDHSADSNQSGGSTQRGRGMSKPEPPAPLQTPPLSQPSLVSNAQATVESMRNLGNTLNPLNRFTSIGIPRFGRTATASPVTEKGRPSFTSTPTDPKSAVEDPNKEAKAVATLEELRKVTPPIRKFLEMKDARDLKVGDLDALLKDYQRIAGVLSKAIVN